MYIILICLIVTSSFTAAHGAFIPQKKNGKSPRYAVSKRMGTEVGNGGLSVVCGKERYFYDYYSYITKDNYRTFELQKFDHMSPSRIIQVLISSLSHIDAEFTDKILKSTKSISYAGFLVGEGHKKKYPISKNSKNPLKEQDCRSEQIIFHNFRLDTHYYSVDFSAFNEMDTVNQALTIIHEALYLHVNFENREIVTNDLTYKLSEYVEFILEVNQNGAYSDKSSLKDLKQKHHELIKNLIK